MVVGAAVFAGFARADDRASAGKEGLKKDPDRLTLIFTAFERDEPFYQTVETELTQTVTIDGQKTASKYGQTWTLKWTPVGKKEQNTLVRQQVVGLKLAIESGETKVAFDSARLDRTDPKDPVVRYLTAMSKQDLTFAIGPKLNVVSVQGRAQSVREMAEVSPAMKSLLDAIYDDRSVWKSAEALWGALPPRAVAVGESWEKSSELDASAVGKFVWDSTHTLSAATTDEATIRTTATVTYKTAAIPAGLPFTVKKGEFTAKSASGELTFSRKKGRIETSRTTVKIVGSFAIEVGNATTEFTIEKDETTSTRCFDANPFGRSDK